MKKLIVRASEASNLMTLPRAKKDQGVTLSETTKSWLKTKAKEQFYKYDSFDGNKFTEKGNLMEDKAIKLLSEYEHFNEDVLIKNTERKNKGGFTGECDLLHEGKITDVKCPWSLDTFPAFIEDANKALKKSGYDWQQKVYCYLWGVTEARISYVMMPTPHDLLNTWDNWDLHIVDHLTIGQRITISHDIILKDEDVELMEGQYKIANEYYLGLIEELENK